MPKVKMRDIKSGSENVKNIFRRTMLQRTLKWLQKQKYSNIELMEILQISEKIERHRDHRQFYRLLIESQSGPFNAEVFNTYKAHVFQHDALMNLITNSKGINNEDKARWIDYTIISSVFWFMPNFYMNDKCKEFGIDIKKSPFNKRLAISVVIYKHASMKVSNSMGIFPLDYETFMWSVLDSLTEEELYDWYIEAVSTTYMSSAVSFLKKYPNTTSDMLEHYYEKSNINELAEHPNFPHSLKVKIYERTGDDKYLPEKAVDMFLF